MADDPVRSSLDIRASGVLVVDDEPANVRLLEKMLLAEGYRNVVSTQDPRETLDLCRQQHSDLVLLDINMPYMDGFEVMAQLRRELGDDAPPILILTAQHQRDNRLRALEGGARDFLAKPFDRAELLARVRNLIEVHQFHKFIRSENEVLDTRVRQATAELRETRLQIVQRLGRAAEYRDNETGFHILRMSHTAVLLAHAIGWGESECELLLHASPMHDIGKIGIPDGILLKPGKLDPQEWGIMKTHTTIGAHILEGDGSDLLTMAREIALTHHEKWDGSGYPKGLKGEDIPMSGRLTAIADVFDALTSDRPYKKAWSVDEAVDFIRDNNGKHFDPKLAALFGELLPEVLRIRARYAEPGSSAAPR